MHFHIFCYVQNICFKDYLRLFFLSRLDVNPLRYFSSTQQLSNTKFSNSSSCFAKQSSANPAILVLAYREFDCRKFGVLVSGENCKLSKNSFDLLNEKLRTSYLFGSPSVSMKTMSKSFCVCS